MPKKIYVVTDITDVLGVFSNKKAAWGCAEHNCPNNEGTEKYRDLCKNGNAYLFNYCEHNEDKLRKIMGDEWRKKHLKDVEVWIEECQLESVFVSPEGAFSGNPMGDVGPFNSAGLREYSEMTESMSVTIKGPMVKGPITRTDDGS